MHESNERLWPKTSGARKYYYHNISRHHEIINPGDTNSLSATPFMQRKRPVRDRPSNVMGGELN